jgi:hypothetical protein
VLGCKVQAGMHLPLQRGSLKKSFFLEAVETRVLLAILLRRLSAPHGYTAMQNEVLLPNGSEIFICYSYSEEHKKKLCCCFSSQVLQFNTQQALFLHFKLAKYSVASS